MRNIGLSFHIRGRKKDGVSDDDAYDVATQGIFYCQTLFFFLTLLDAQRLNTEADERGDLPIEFENLGELGYKLLSASLAHVEQLEDARKENAEKVRKIFEYVERVRQNMEWPTNLAAEPEGGEQ